MTKMAVPPPHVARALCDPRAKPWEESAAQLDLLVKRHLPALRLHPLSQKAIPQLAKDPRALKAIARAVRGVPTGHHLWLGELSGNVSHPGRLGPPDRHFPTIL